MKRTISLIPYVLLIWTLGIMGCTDSLNKTTSLDDTVRIEYSACLGLGCLECMTRFHCPYNAIKTDERTGINYIDADLCVQCLECTNIFQCPQRAIRTRADRIPPAPVTGLQGISVQIGQLQIEFIATGDDSTDTGGTRAYLYQLTLFDANDQIIPVDFIPPVPLKMGTHEYWEPIDSLPPGENITIQLTAFDEAGNASAAAAALVQIMDYPDLIPPAAVNDLQIFAVSQNSVSLQWTAPGDDGWEGTVTNYIIKAHTAEINSLNWEQIPSCPNAIIPLPAGQTEEFVVAGLQSGTYYFFALKAIDEAGNISAISNLVSAATEEDIDLIPPALIDDLHIDVYSISMNSFTLYWTAVGDDGLDGTASFYIVKIHTEPIDEDNWDMLPTYQHSIVPSPSGTSESLSVTGLDPLTEYFAGIKTGDEAGNLAEVSNIVSAETTDIPDTIPPAAITDLTAEGFETLIELAWTAPGDDGMLGTAEYYEIRMYDTGITAYNWNAAALLPDPPLPLPAGTTQNYIVSGLNYNQVYFFAIKTFDDNANVSEVSNSPSAQLMQDAIPPADITDLIVIAGYASNLSTIKIQWTAPGDDGNIGTADHYEIRYAQQPITAANWQNAIEFPNPPAPLPAGSSQFCNVTGLSAATIYYFAIKAFDEAGNGNNVSNSPAGKIVYQINTAACHNCNNCINDCSVGAIHQGPGYKYINPDQCIACGDCSCPWNLIYMAVVAY